MSEPWTKAQKRAIENDSVLSRLGTEGLDALLSDEERDAVQQHIDHLATLRRRVEAETRGERMP